MLKEITVFATVLATSISAMVASAFIITQYFDKEKIRPVQIEINKLKPQKSGLETIVKALGDQKDNA